MSDVDRDKLYSAGAGDRGDEGTEYEVEPPDPQVLAAEECRAEEILAASQLAVELQEIDDEADGRSDRQYLGKLVRGFRFRFRTKDLLVATTVAAVLMAVAVQHAFGRFFVLAALIVVGGITAILSWKQYEREVELDRRRQALLARRREQRAAGGKQSGVSPAGLPPEPNAEPARAVSPGRRRFRLRFTMAEMIVVMICAAVLFGLIGVWGLAMTATLIGLVALGGLVLHATGVQPPYAVVFGWWVLLLLYIVLTLIAMVWGGPPA
jgi:hypothetical protein